MTRNFKGENSLAQKVYPPINLALQKRGKLSLNFIKLGHRMINNFKGLKVYPPINFQVTQESLPPPLSIRGVNFLIIWGYKTTCVRGLKPCQREAAWPKQG